MSNIHGLGSVRAEKKANDEEYSQGAAGQSGTAVWRPNASAARGGAGAAAAGGPPDLINDIIANARNNSNAPSASGALDRNVGVITVYANGFIFGSAGEFRDLKDPKNKQFLEDLKKGEVPEEFNAICAKEWPGQNGGDVAVSLVDKSKETYTPPKPKFDFAKSQGQSLAAAAAGPSGAAASAAAFTDATPQRLVVDASQPTTTLQLVFAGKKVKETANQSATVMQLYQHFISLSGLSGFELVAGFPPKPLTNPSATLKEAGFLNGSVSQRGGS